MNADELEKVAQKLALIYYIAACGEDCKENRLKIIEYVGFIASTLGGAEMAERVHSLYEAGKNYKEAGKWAS